MINELVDFIKFIFIIRKLEIEEEEYNFFKLDKFEFEF